MSKDTLFSMQTVPLKFGWGATREVGADARALGIRRCLLLTDRRLATLGLADDVAGFLCKAGVDTEIYDRVRCELDDASWLAAFQFTGATEPARHLEAAALIGSDTRDASPKDGGELIARRLIELMRRFNLPDGLSGVGFTESDLPALVEGAMKQQRLLVLSPRPVSEADMNDIFRAALRYW